MRRRALLASGSTLLAAGLAGCLGQSGPDTDEPPTQTTAEPTNGTPTTDEPTTDRTTEQPTYDATVAPEFGRLQPGVVLVGIDSIGVHGDGQQYLFYRVEVTDGDPPERSAFEFRFDGDAYSPDVDTSGRLWRPSEHEDWWYTADDGAGWVVFELPESGDASDAAFALGDQEWSVPESVRERLAEPAPELSLDWDVPVEQPPAESTLGFTVSNDGDRDTWFVGALNGVQMYAAVSPIRSFLREVPAGETVSWEFTHDNGTEPGSDDVGDGEPDGTYRLFWNGGRREQEIRVVEASGGE